LNKIIDDQILINLYKKGYFPMAESSFSKKVNFYKPNKRFIIPIDNFHIPKKLYSQFKKTNYDFKINLNFNYIIHKCSLTNKKREGTWINSLIKDSYINLYNKGYAKCIQCSDKGNIIGGLYGVKIGKCFFGESMFSEKNNVSKFCLLILISILKKNNFTLLDSQFLNPHLVQFGGYEINNDQYNIILKKKYR